MKVHLCSGVQGGLTEELQLHSQTWGRTHGICGQTPQAPAGWHHHSLGCAMGWALAKDLLPWTLLRGRAGKNSPAEWTLAWEQLSGETLLGKARDRQGCQLCPHVGDRTHQSLSISVITPVHWALAGCGAGWSSAKATLELSGCNNCSSEALSEFLTQWKSNKFWC